MFAAVMGRADLILETAMDTVSFKPWGSLTASVDLQVTNTGASSELVNTGQVGFVLVPVSVESGGLSMSFGLPTSNALINDSPGLTWLSAMPLSPAVTIGGNDYDTFDLGIVAENDVAYNNVLAAAAFANLATLEFTATDVDTVGTWQLYAVNTTSLWTGWGTSVYDGGSEQYNVLFTPYGNIPQADGTAVLLTTITVPEPSTWWMAGSAAVGTALAAWRKRRCRTASRPIVTPAA